MNAKQKIILACVAGLLCIGVAWYLFSVPSTGPTDSSRVEKRLDDTAREQQKAADSIEAVSRGLEDSTDRAADIDAGLGQDQGRVESIQDRNAELETGIDSITERNRTALERLDEAEAGNEDAARSVADAAAAVDSCGELARRSAEILGRYQDGVSEERESPRENREASEKQD